jgi:hypothetical protein
VIYFDEIIFILPRIASGILQVRITAFGLFKFNKVSCIERKPVPVNELFRISWVVGPY